MYHGSKNLLHFDYEASEPESQISSQPDLDSPSHSDFKLTPESLPTTISTSTPEKSNSNHSLPTPTQNFSAVEQKIKPPPPLITSTSA